MSDRTAEIKTLLSAQFVTVTREGSELTSSSRRGKHTAMKGMVSQAEQPLHTRPIRTKAHGREKET